MDNPIKRYALECFIDNEGECPQVVYFEIERATAIEIARLAAIVTANGAHKIEKFDYRAFWLSENPFHQEGSEEFIVLPTNPEELIDWDPSIEMDTQCDSLVVSANTFHFTCYLNHDNNLIYCRQLPIADLIKQLGITPEDIAEAPS